MEIVKLSSAAQSQAKALLVDQDSEKDGLRVAVEGGGCNGLRYKIGFDFSSPQDTIYGYENGLMVMVDQKSSALLEGCSLEFHNRIDKMGFEVINPNAGGTCGCGESFAC